MRETRFGNFRFSISDCRLNATRTNADDADERGQKFREVKMKTQLTRREFLKLSSAAALSATLAACGVNPTPTPAPTNTPLATATSLPTATPFPTATVIPTASRTSISTVPATPAPTATPRLTIEQMNSLPLRSLADLNRATIGTLYSIAREDAHQQELGAQFNGITIADPFSWKFLRRDRDKNDYWGIRRGIDFTLKNNQKVQALHLIWGSEKHLPSWILQSGLTPNQYLDEMVTTIEVLASEVRRYLGRDFDIVSAWNEIFGGFEFGLDFWLKKFGDKHRNIVKQILQLIERRFPQSLRMLNDDNIIPGLTYFNERKTAAFWELVDWLDSQGIVGQNAPLNAIGLQGHFLCKDFRTPNLVKTNLNRIVEFANRVKTKGLMVVISEWDLRLDEMNDLPLEQRYRVQGDIAEAMMNVFLSEGISNVFIFGTRDGGSWLKKQEWNPKHYSYADPLPYRDDGTSKPFADGLRKAYITHSPYAAS